MMAGGHDDKHTHHPKSSGSMEAGIPMFLNREDVLHAVESAVFGE